MLRRRTTIVIGAGASAEYGLPVGKELKTQIQRYLSFVDDPVNQHYEDSQIQSIMFSITNGNMEHKAIHSAKVIRNGLDSHSSIDNLLDIHQNNNILVSLAKSVICKIILEKERESILSLPDDKPVRLHGDNYRKYLGILFDIVTKSVKKEDVGSIFDKLCIVSFNYDRCLVHFFYNALQTHYNISAEEAASVMGRLNILYPYGSLAPLEWQDDSVGIRFGSSYAPFMNNVSDTYIKTFTESVEDETVESVKSNLRLSEICVFLGFGFHEQNMELLNPIESVPIHEFIATVVGQSPIDVDLLRSQLRSWTGGITSPGTHLLGIECSNILTHCFRLITS
jgi:hypothetical protein